MVGLAANERSTKQHTKVAKGGWPLWMGRLERMEDDIVFVGIVYFVLKGQSSLLCLMIAVC